MTEIPDYAELQALMLELDGLIPEDVEAFIVLAAGSGITSICKGADKIAKDGPEILGSMLKSVCQRFNIDIWDGVRRLQEATLSRLKTPSAYRKFTFLAHLSGGPLDGQTVELCQEETVIAVPFWEAEMIDRINSAAPLWSDEPIHTQYAHYAVEASSKLEGRNLHYRYGRPL